MYNVLPRNHNVRFWLIFTEHYRTLQNITEHYIEHYQSMLTATQTTGLMPTVRQ